MRNTHEDEKINALVGCKVECTFIDGDVEVGVLYKNSDYKIDDYAYLLHIPYKHDVSFDKQHIKNIEKVDETK